MEPPSIDVIIPVHTPTRPIRRAVSSVLSAQSRTVRALVVCHNIAVDQIAANLQGIDDSRLTLLEYHDDIPSPAGPLNAGVRAARAEYVAFLGSDDELEIGALDAWLAELNGQQVHIGQLIADNGQHIFAPAPRVGRFNGLDPVKDLLNYRTAPVGALISRELLSSADSPGFTERVRTGEDIGLGAFVWNTARSITYSRCHEGYRVRDDQHDRVSEEWPDFGMLIAPVDALLEEPWLAGISRHARNALGAKLLRYQVLEPYRELVRSHRVDAATRQEVTHIITALRAFAPQAIGRLPRREAVPARLLLAGAPTAAERHLATPGPGWLWDRLLPGNPLRLLEPEGLIRRAIRHWFILRSLSAKRCSTTNLPE